MTTERQWFEANDPIRWGFHLPQEISRLTITSMESKMIARVSWDLPHGEERVQWMSDSDRVTFGRASECSITIGRVPYDERVPTIWGRLTWGGRIRVENLAERVAKWSFTLHPTFAPDAPRDESHCVVSPGMEASLATSQFEIRAIAPGGIGIPYSIRVNAFPRPRPVVIESENPSIIEVVLTPAEKTVGRALIRPLEEGSPVPATYEQIAAGAHYSKDGTRDAIGRIDAKFVAANLYQPVTGGRAPERVSRVLFEQRSLLS